MTILWPPFVGWMFFCSLLFRILSRTRVIYQGREINVDEVGANDIAIVEDIEDFRIGDYLGAKPCLIQGLSHQHPLSNLLSDQTSPKREAR